MALIGHLNHSVFDIIGQICLLRLAGDCVCNIATIFITIEEIPLVQPFVLKIFVEYAQRRIKVLYFGYVFDPLRNHFFITAINR